MTIRIQLPIQTKPRPRARVFGKFANVYTPKEAVKYEKAIASEYVRLGGKDFGDKPVTISLMFNFKIPKGTPKWMVFGVENGMTQCCIHKDLDNLAKSIFDALNGVAYEDDRQIIYTDIGKYWTTEEDFIIIDIEQAPTKSEKEIKEQFNLWKNSLK